VTVLATPALTLMLTAIIRAAVIKSLQMFFIFCIFYDNYRLWRKIISKRQTNSNKKGGKETVCWKIALILAQH
jgi:hypothetical protein